MRSRSDRRDQSLGKKVFLSFLALGMALGAFADPAGAQDAKAQALLDKIIAAHGGMQAWDNLKDFTFMLRRIILSPQGDVTAASTSLYYMKRFEKARVETLTGKGLQVQGFDGRKPWVTVDGKPDTREEALKAVHFQAINWWYWWGIPFKLKDPGVIVQHKGTTTSQGRSVEVLEATFQPGVGQTNDRYTYYIDPGTYHILYVDFQLQPGVWPGIGGNIKGPWLDYKKEGPFTIHTKRIYERPQGPIVTLFTDFQFNTGLSDKLFTAP